MSVRVRVHVACGMCLSVRSGWVGAEIPSVCGTARQKAGIERRHRPWHGGGRADYIQQAVVGVEAEAGGRVAARHPQVRVRDGLAQLGTLQHPGYVQVVQQLHSRLGERRDGVERARVLGMAILAQEVAKRPVVHERVAASLHDTMVLLDAHVPSAPIAELAARVQERIVPGTAGGHDVRDDHRRIRGHVCPREGGRRGGHRRNMQPTRTRMASQWGRGGLRSAKERTGWGHGKVCVRAQECTC